MLKLKKTFIDDEKNYFKLMGDDWINQSKIFPPS